MTTTDQFTVPPGLLTTADVAQVFRASESTVRYWRAQGTGPKCFKAGRRVLYRSEDVAAHLERPDGRGVLPLYVLTRHQRERPGMTTHDPTS